MLHHYDCALCEWNNSIPNGDRLCGNSVCSQSHSYLPDDCIQDCEECCHVAMCDAGLECMESQGKYLNGETGRFEYRPAVRVACGMDDDDELPF